MEKVNILVIGAGAVGLACGAYLSKNNADVVIVEQENTFGRHTSSRNSQVIHSGIYYPTFSFKHRLCIRGNKLLYDFCQKRKVEFKKTGKLIVATNDDELKNLNQLMQNALSNGVKGVTLLNQKQIYNLEEKIKAKHALLVPSTGIFNSHNYMQALSDICDENDAFIIYNTKVNKINLQNNKYLVEMDSGEQFLCNKVINCGGLFANEISAKAGFYTPKVHYCKGEYYKSSGVKGIKHLVYPVPDENGISLGIHLVLDLAGQVRFGPNAIYTNELKYNIDENNQKSFYKAISKYIDVDEYKLHPDDAGIRPKLQGKNDEFKDFYIKLENKNFVNMIGIDSPGLTSSLAIAEFVCELLK